MLQEGLTLPILSSMALYKSLFYLDLKLLISTLGLIVHSVFLKKFYFILYLLIYFWFHWVFVAVHGLSLVAVSGGYSLLRCVGFSLWWLLLLWSTGSRCAGFSSCGTRAQLLCGMWDLPGPGLDPLSPALAGRFLTTAPPEKSLHSVF